MITRSAARPERGIQSGHFLEKRLVHGAFVWRASVLRGQPFCKKINGDHADHERDRGDEIPFYTGVVFEGVDVHAEEAHDKSQGQEDEGDPAQAPHYHIISLYITCLCFIG